MTGSTELIAQKGTKLYQIPREVAVPAGASSLCNQCPKARPRAQ